MAKGKFQKPRTMPADDVQPVIEELPVSEAQSVIEEQAPMEPQPIQEQPIPTSAPAEPTYAQQNLQKQTGKKRPRVGLIVLIVCLCLAVLFGGTVLWGAILQSGGNIYPNVYVAGVNVGGMTRDEAVAAVNAQAEAAYESYSLTVRLPDRSLTFTPEQTGIAVNADDAVEEAARFGRQTGVLGSFVNWVLAHAKDSHISLETSLLLDTDYIRDMIDQVAQDAKQSMEQPVAVFDEEKGMLTLTLGKPQRALDADGLFDAVVSAFMAHSEEPLEWAYDEIACDEPDFDAYAAQYGTAVSDASYDAEKRVIVESVRGYGVDPKTAEEALATAKEGETLTLPFVHFEPEVSTEQLTEQMFGTVLHEVSSSYVNNKNRTTNLELACAAINGTILNPGDTFSFNDIVGERTADKGYKPATVYVTGGASDSQLGGGICQVASTIYYGTLHLFNVEQVQREPHMYAVTYVPMGMDAAIYWDMKQDYKFKNTGEHPMQILTWLADGKVHVKFLGVKETENTIKMTYKVLATYPYEEEEKVDETKEPGYREETTTPYTGYKVVTYKTIYDKDGKELSTEEGVYSTYKKRNRVFTVGPAEEPEMPEWVDPGIVLPNDIIMPQ